VSDRVTDVLRRKFQGETIQVVETTPADHGAGLVAKAIGQDRARLLIIFGGDGTVSEAAQGAMSVPEPKRVGAEFALLPAGRGNDFFRSLIGRVSSSDRLRAGLEILESGGPKPMDLAEVTYLRSEDDSGGKKLEVAPRVRVFVNVLSFGYGGLVVSRVKSRAGWVGKADFLKRSGLTYAAQTLAGLSEYRPVRVRVRVDGRSVFEGPVFSGFVLNGAYNGGGMCWSSEARIDDGLLTLHVGQPMGLSTMARYSGRMRTGEWAGVPGVTLAAGREIEIQDLEGPEKRTHPLTEVDGDLPESPGANWVKVKVLPGAWNFWRQAH
jgi:diacylglycerol kinase family enzyme